MPYAIKLRNKWHFTWIIFSNVNGHFRGDFTSTGWVETQSRDKIILDADMLMSYRKIFCIFRGKKDIYVANFYLHSIVFYIFRWKKNSRIFPAPHTWVYMLSTLRLFSHINSWVNWAVNYSLLRFHHQMILKKTIKQICWIIYDFMNNFPSFDEYRT